MQNRNALNLVLLDYGNGFTYRPCCVDPPCGLGDLMVDGKVVEANVTQREARRAQVDLERVEGSHV